MILDKLALLHVAKQFVPILKFVRLDSEIAFDKIS